MRFASDAKRESPAERIAERLIGGILAEEDRFSAIGVHRHYRLYDLVGRNVELSDEERLFVRRRSHLDFLLYNRMDNTPILGIEVDACSTTASTRCRSPATGAKTVFSSRSACRFCVSPRTAAAKGADRRRARTGHAAGVSAEQRQIRKAIRDRQDTVRKQR